MQINYNTHAARKPVNLSANVDLINRVRSENGNLSALLERSMIEFLSEKELARWKEESRESFDSYNSMIEVRGPISEDVGLQL